MTFDRGFESETQSESSSSDSSLAVLQPAPHGRAEREVHRADAEREVLHRACCSQLQSADVLGTSSLQDAMILQHMKAPEDGTFLESIVWHFSGALDVPPPVESRAMGCLRAAITTLKAAPRVAWVVWGQLSDRPQGLASPSSPSHNGVEKRL